MLQSTKIDSCASNLRAGFDANQTGVIRGAAQGDLARDQRHTPGQSRIESDFATGIRTVSPTTIIGHLSSAPDGLPLAA